MFYTPHFCYCIHRLLFSPFFHSLFRTIIQKFTKTSLKRTKKKKQRKIMQATAYDEFGTQYFPIRFARELCQIFFREWTGRKVINVCFQRYIFFYCIPWELWIMVSNKCPFFGEQLEELLVSHNH